MSEVEHIFQMFKNQIWKDISSVRGKKGKEACIYKYGFMFENLKLALLTMVYSFQS